MKERPILMSAPMVRALLDGSKTETRRVIKPQPVQNHSPIANGCWEWPVGGTRIREDTRTWFGPDTTDVQRIVAFCPYGKVGDHLWVRETFMIESNCNVDSNDGYPPPFKDGRPTKFYEDTDWCDYWEQPHYAATDPKPELATYDDDSDELQGWRPSIFMPRWASRITLEITEIRAQQLGDMSETDCIAEGYPHDPNEIGMSGVPLPLDWYRDLWNSLNGKKHPWDPELWVWAISFKRVKSKQTEENA